MTQPTALVHCFGMLEPTVMHFLFDAVAWAVALALFNWQQLYFPAAYATIRADLKTWGGLLCMGGGAVLGYLISGRADSLNPIVISHNLGCAWVGVWIALEFFRQSKSQGNGVLTVLVLPFAVGLAITRAGCHQLGLADVLRGDVVEMKATLAEITRAQLTGQALPHPFYTWNFGDAMFRYPIQMYESLLMWLFAGVFALCLRRQSWRARLEKLGAPLFLMYFALEKFALQYLAGYGKFLYGMSGRHWFAIGLFVYALILMDQRASEPALSINPESTE